MLLAFDFDGTLLPDGGVHVPEPTIQALHRLRDLGVKYAVITGRDQLPAAAQDALQPHGLATNNGGRIMLDDHVHAEATFTPQDLEQVLTHALPRARVVAFGQRGLYVEHPEDQELAPWLLARHPRPMAEAAQDTILKIGFYHPQVAAHAAQLRDRSPHLTLTGAQAPYHEFLTVTPQSAHKGAALSTLAGALGVDIRDTVAFGDSDNDLAMFRVAGRAVQVGELPLLREAAHEQISGPDALHLYLNGLADGLERRRP